MAALGAVFFVSPVLAQQPQCNERDIVIELLEKKYGETTVSAGVTGTGGLLEVLTNKEAGTWTIIVTSPKQLSCLVASGDGWRNFSLDKLDPEA